MTRSNSHRLRSALLMLCLALALVACSVDISPPSATATRPGADEADPGDSAPGSLEGTTGGEGSPAWADRGLAGSLFFIAFDGEHRQNIHRLDLETGALATIFESEPDTLLADVAASPDGSRIVFAYAPPPPEGEVQFGFTDLYLMQADGSAEPEILLERSDSTETFYNISWPLDNTIYYAHFTPTTGDLGERIYANQVERLHVAEGNVEVVTRNAAWPRLSPDGSMLAYVTDTNDMVIAEPGGGGARVFIKGTAFLAVDAPLFSPDNSWLYFSAVESTTGDLSWFDRLLGVQIAEAHNVPSDWWRKALSGDDMEQLTNLSEIGIYGDFSPDGEHIAFITTNGLHVMQRDGSGVFRLLNVTATGTLNWVDN